jgi:hypothetical protein
MMLARPRPILSAALLFAALAAVPSAWAERPELATGPRLAAGEPSGLVHARGQAAPGGAAATSPSLIFRGGTIMPDSQVTAIYWGPSWSAAGYQADKISGIASLYTGLAGSSYMHTSSEYTGTNGQVGTSVGYAGHVIDTSATPRRAPKTADVLAAVARAVPHPVANGYYPVYSDIKRGSAGYCAWHSWGTIGGVPVQFAFFFDLAGDAGCDPQDPRTVWSQGLEALANVSGHEFSEAVTDPRGTGWTDNQGYENADKCAWTFGAPTVTLTNGTSWKIQGNWSNAAYNLRSGYAKGGCIQTS